MLRRIYLLGNRFFNSAVSFFLFHFSLFSVSFPTSSSFVRAWFLLSTGVSVYFGSFDPSFFAKFLFRFSFLIVRVCASQCNISFVFVMLLNFSPFTFFSAYFHLFLLYFCCICSYFVFFCWIQLMLIRLFLGELSVSRSTCVSLFFLPLSLSITLWFGSHCLSSRYS